MGLIASLAPSSPSIPFVNKHLFILSGTDLSPEPDEKREINDPEPDWTSKERLADEPEPILYGLIAELLNQMRMPEGKEEWNQQRQIILTRVTFTDEKEGRV